MFEIEATRNLQLPVILQHIRGQSLAPADTLPLMLYFASISPACKHSGLSLLHPMQGISILLEAAIKWTMYRLCDAHCSVKRCCRFLLIQMLKLKHQIQRQM